MKKAIAVLCTLSLIALFFTGCSSTSTPSAAPQATPTPAATATPAGVIKVGVPAPFSGSAAVQAANLKYGTQLAIDEINASGGVNGMKIEPVYIDTENKAEVAVAAYEKLCTSNKVDIIVGEVTSSIALAVMDVISKYNMPTIFAIPPADALGDKIKSDPTKYGMIFMTDPPTSQMQDGVLTFLKESVANKTISAPNKTIAMIHEDSDWGKSTYTAWSTALKADGWKFVVDETMATTETDFYNVFTKIAQAKPDIIKIEFASVTAGAAATKQLAEMGLKATVFAGYYMKTTDFSKLAGNMAQYQLNILEPLDQNFSKKVIAKYPDASPIGCCWSYDSIYIMANAIKKAGSLDKAKLIAAIGQTDYTGVIMRTVFDQTTHFAKSGKDYKFYGVAQYIDNQLVPIYPANIATGKLQTPK